MKKTKAILSKEEIIHLPKEYINLSKATIPLSFGLTLSNNSTPKKVVVKYGEGYENEEFYDFDSYLHSLASYYRNRIDIVEENEEKITLCNRFIDVLQGYKIDLRFQFKDQAKFVSEISFYKEQFEYYKSRFLETKEIKISEQANKKTYLTLKQQLLVLHYMGSLEANEQDTTTQKLQAKFISELLNANIDNVTKGLRYVNSVPIERGSDIIKTKKNLEAVRVLFTETKQNSLLTKVQSDIDRIKMG